VHALDEFFHRKYADVGERDAHDLRQVSTAEEVLAELQAKPSRHLHMPSPSYWPIIVAASLPLIAYGLVFHLLMSVAGVTVLVTAMFGWALEPSVEPTPDLPPGGGAGAHPGTALATTGERTTRSS
jgi:cytochrome c oxidase subunit 1